MFILMFIFVDIKNVVNNDHNNDIDKRSNKYKWLVINKNIKFNNSITIGL